MKFLALTTERGDNGIKDVVCLNSHMQNRERGMLQKKYCGAVKDMEIGKEMCFYHIWNQLEEEDRRKSALEFFCRICQACGFDDRQMQSLMFLQASYGLWERNPAGEEEITDCMEKVSSLPCSSCEDVLADYEEYHIQEVCVLCPHSPLFRNAGIKKERTVLRRLLSDFEICCRSGKSIFSCMVRLAPDYAAGRYPVVPLHTYMYNYLLSFGMASIDHTKTDFLGNFCDYLLSSALPHDLGDHSADPAVVKMIVQRELQKIMAVPPESILPDVFDRYVKELKNTPTAHKVLESHTIISQCGDPAALKHGNGQMDLLEDVMSGLGEPEETGDKERKSDPENIFSAEGAGEDPSDNDVSESLPEKVPLSEEPEVTESLPEDVAYFCNSEEETIPEENVVLDSMDHPEPDTLPEETSLPDRTACSTDSGKILCTGNTLTDKEENTDPVYVPYVLFLPQDRFGEQIHVFSMQGQGYLQWVAAAWQSEFLCVEPVCRYGREGLILYLSDNDNFYYLDLEVHADVFRQLLSEDSGLILTAHAPEVYSLLYTYGFDHPPVHGLDILSGTAGKESPSLPTAPLSVQMRLYPELYGTMMNQTDDRQKKEYTENLRIIAVLSRSFGLRRICPQLSSPVVPDGFMKFHFSFLPSFSWEESGVLFRLEIPGLSPDSLSCTSLAGQLIRLFDRLHHTCRTRAYPLAFRGSLFFFFYHGCHRDAMIFYDAYLIAAMELYEKMMNRPLHCRSFCAVWENRRPLCP